MSQELTHTRDGQVLRSRLADLKSGLYRILIPAGTHVWRGAADTYAVDEPASALLSFDAPPAGLGEPCGPDTRNTLARLWAGATLSFYSPERSGSLLLSQPESTSLFRADRDRWLYLQLTFPAGKALAWKSQIDLHADAAPEKPDIDAALLERTRQYVNASGYTDAIRAFGGFGPGEDAALVAKATACGLVKALTDMVRMAEEAR